MFSLADCKIEMVLYLLFMMHFSPTTQVSSISVQPTSLLSPAPPHKETEYEHFLRRSLTVMEYLLKRKECALICQGDLS